jgi:hypothetical protein
MNAKVTPDHIGRGAVVYVRQSTIGQVAENTESQRRQYALAESAQAMGFASVTIIDDDLGRSGSGTIERPGFQKLVASVCTGSVGAVFCIEGSRLARNGRDWHHLIDLCALVGAWSQRHDVGVRIEPAAPARACRARFEGLARRAALRSAAGILLERDRSNRDGP